MIDLQHEIKRELNQTEAPDLWDRIQARAADTGDADVVDLAAVRRRRPALWIVVAAAAVVVVLAAGAGALVLADDDEIVKTTPITEVPTPVSPAWSGAVREPSEVVQALAPEGEDSFSWDDPVDATEPWVDVTHVTWSPRGNQGSWQLHLAAPRVGLDPGVVYAYGLVFDTDGDGAADYVVGVDNAGRRPGDFRAWFTDLATGKTDERVEGPYGSPIEFRHPMEQPGFPWVILTFLSAPVQDLLRDSVRFYAWTSASRDGEVFAHDFAPDTGWISEGP